MFSFFRKNPPPAAAPEAERPPAAAADAGASTGSGDPAAQRSRSARDWLNADVGELLFGKKPVAPAPSAPVPIGPPMATPAAAVAPAQAPAVVQAAAATTSDADRAGWMAKLKSGLQRTGGAIAGAFIGAEIGDELYEDLEVALLQADAGADATIHLLDELQRRVTRAHVRDPAAARRLLARCIEELLQPLERPLVIGAHTPTVIMVVGVNGAGKTTTIKLVVGINSPDEGSVRL